VTDGDIERELARRETLRREIVALETKVRRLRATIQDAETLGGPGWAGRAARAHLQLDEVLPQLHRLRLSLR